MGKKKQTIVESSPLQDLGHWTTEEEIPVNPYGFVYLITNTITSQQYTGKCQMTSRLRIPPLKGKKRRRIKVSESDWRIYTGSSERLNADIEKHGKDYFRFEILKFCSSKWELKYSELEEQVKRQVLLLDRYYNGIINIKLGKAPKNLRITDEDN